MPPNDPSTDPKVFWFLERTKLIWAFLITKKSMMKSTKFKKKSDNLKMKKENLTSLLLLIDKPLANQFIKLENLKEMNNSPNIKLELRNQQFIQNKDHKRISIKALRALRRKKFS